VLSALTTARFVSAFFGTGNVGVVISTGLLVVNAYTKKYDLGELALKHKEAANDIWLIRDGTCRSSPTLQPRLSRSRHSGRSGTSS